jgi:glycosyltransferase involved in cell wall biosynthesis
VVPISVMYDGEAFMRHARGGIPRYLTELIGEFRGDPDLGVVPVTPYKWVASRHLAELDRHFIELPLPRRARLGVLRTLNGPRLRRTQPADLVHHSLYEPNAFERWHGRKHVTTVYDFMLQRFPELLKPGDDHLERFGEVLRRADAVVCISEATREDLHRFHPDYDRPVFAIPLGVGDDFFDPRPARLPTLPEKYVLSVSNRMEHKNADVLLHAFAELSRRHPGLQLVLVGAYLPSETDQLSSLGILDRTVRLRVTDAALPWLYRKADVMVYPSRWEGFGLPVAEAMASSCPAVVSDLPALREVGGDAVRYFEGNGTASLVEHVERVLTDPTEAERMRRDGVSRARLFTWRRTAELTAEAYRTVLDS